MYKIKKIKYCFSNNLISTGLEPSKNIIPTWYKKGKNNIEESQDPFNTKTFKSCIPFFDSLVSGYTLLTTQDIYVEYKNNSYSITHSLENNLLTEIQLRDSEILIPVPSGYSGIFHFVWMTNAYLETPKGYSLLITHPFNRYDLPFITSTAIVDCDKVAMVPGRIPFFLQLGFSGLIPVGTPIAQVFPFKREPWGHQIDQSLVKTTQKASLDANRTRGSIRFYKNNWWSKKSYE